TAAEGGDTFTVENLNSDVAVGVRFEVIDWWVDGTNGDDGNAGRDEAAPLQTIAKALDAAAPGETIYVAPGVYPPLDTTGKDCPVRIAAASLSRETSARTGARMLLPTDLMPIIDALHRGPAAILGPDHIIQGFCLRHGANWSFDESAGGGGLRGGTAMDCLLEENFALHGGGAGLATLARCIIRHCRSLEGGALFDCRAFDSLIENNFAHVGGGALGGELLNCTLAGNRAHVGGGAARGNKSSSSSSMLRVIECVFPDNHSANGRPGVPEDLEEQVSGLEQPLQPLHRWAMSFSPRAHVLTDSSGLLILLPDFVDPFNADYRLRAGSPFLLPDFVDPFNGDYRLREDSPFLRPTGERSMPKAAARRDADGREWDVRGEGFPRVVDGEMDWGAYEGAVEGWVVSVLVDGWGGRVSERTLVVPDGGEATVTAIEESRGFTGWMVDGEDAGTALTLTLSNVTTDHVAVACFERRTTEVSGGGAALQEAIDAAVDGDTLVVGPGTYSAIDATGRYLEIVSAEGPEKTFIRGEKGADAASCKRAATFSPATEARTSRLSGFTLAGGCCMDDAKGGGGVFGGFLDNCVIAGNEAAFGGGASQSTLTHCRIEGNTAGLLGGGAYMSELDNCLVTGNTVAEAGRAEVAARVEAALGTELPEGYAGGGGIAFSAAYLCTVAGNTAENADGGGGRRVVLDNCIVAGNSATGEGMHQDLGECSAEPQWFCSTEHGWEFWDDPVGFVDAATDEPYADVAGGDFSLRAGSACIDGADASFPEVAEDTDLAGGPRWRAGAPDIGCYESDSIVPAAVTAVSATRSD
ncbi:MAG: right-handed parallel beta-helix repeat-containing protein, partial [Kiritimatiellae bacterium]|nr:right-handed parallel beta-helix repeat-containing protein [Kiritimatiellia bacterium]